MATTTIGPPTTGPHVLNEIWKDALGAVFKCIVGGTPGLWKEILPCCVTADPSSGNIPTGYRIFNVTEGTFERHAVSYVWEAIVGASGGKIGFYGATPVVYSAVADQTAVTLGNVDGEIGSWRFSMLPPMPRSRPCGTRPINSPPTSAPYRPSFTPCAHTAFVAGGVVKGGWAWSLLEFIRVLRWGVIEGQDVALSAIMGHHGILANRAHWLPISPYHH